MFVDTIASIISYDDPSLYREEKEFNFLDVKPTLDRVFQLAKILQNNDTAEWIPDRLRPNIETVLTGVNDTLKQVKSFDPTTGGDPTSVRNSLVQTIQDQYRELYSVLSPLLSYDIARKVDAKALERQQKAVDEAIARIGDKEKQVDRIIAAAEQASGLAGVSEYSRVFSDQAKSYRWLAIAWAILIGLLFWFLIAYLGGIYNDLITKLSDPSIGDLSWQNSVQIFIAKLFLVSVGYYALYQLIKNFNIAMHHNTANLNRSNIMKTYRSFLEAAPEVGKQEVLITAMNAIFDKVDTGYISVKDAGIETSEVVKLFSSLSRRD